MTTSKSGIVATDGVLLVVPSSTGRLFRIDPNTGIAAEVDLGGSVLGTGTADGLELRGRTLYVVRNAENLVTVVRLGPHAASGVVLGDLRSLGPCSRARLDNRDRTRHILRWSPDLGR